MTDAMDAEFDTVAWWTAEVALELGPDHLIPAGCRGSGGPATLDRFLDALDVDEQDRMLDVGAGVGGPAAYAATQRGVRPVLAEPEHGACRAARRLFDLPTVQADATALPIATGSVDVAWSLGVLCTIGDHRSALRELGRVIATDGRVGVLVYEAQHTLPEHPEGNHFPTTDDLSSLVADAGLHVADTAEMSDPDDEPPNWRRRLAAVEDELDRRHHDDEAWREATEQAAIMGRLISGGHIVGRMLVLRVSR